jgi:hypothetical protein
MRESAICPDCSRPFLRKPSDHWRLRCLDCWRRRKATATPDAATAPTAPPLIDADMLRRLIQLAHPDRHGGSEAARIATAWLLEQRQRAREAPRYG